MDTKPLPMDPSSWTASDLVLLFRISNYPAEIRLAPDGEAAIVTRGGVVIAYSDWETALRAILSQPLELPGRRVRELVLEAIVPEGESGAYRVERFNEQGARVREGVN